MEAITQEHRLGCGIASVAFILGITYKDASILFNIQKVSSKGLCCKDLIKTLETTTKNSNTIWIDQLIAIIKNDKM